MIFEVEMHAFAQGKIRRVTVPDHEVSAINGLIGRAVHTLDLAFRYGQNDFCLLDDRGQQLPSVSVGDIIRFEGLRYVVMPTGFKHVAADFMPPEGDRGGMWAYIESAAQEARGR